MSLLTATMPGVSRRVPGFGRRTLRFFLASLRFIVFLGLVGCQQNADTLFTKIEGSGVHFTNALTPTDSLNAFTFTNFYNGGGVGVGDFNRDGRPDLFFTGNQESCRLYLNQTPKGTSAIQFTDITDQAGVRTDRWCTGVSVADVNADGWDDIYVSVAAHPALRQSRNLLFINQRTANPTFREEAAAYGLDYEGFTTQAAFFDYDLDGDLDVFLLNTAPDVQNPNYLRPAIHDGSSPSTDRLFRNEGPQASGPRFRDLSREAGIRYEGLGLGLVVSDVNGDGYPDLYCSNDFISSDILYLNRGDGTFANSTRASLAHTSLYGMGVDAADLNNDGRIDLMQLDMLPQDNARLKQMLGAPDYDKKELSQTPQYGYQLQYMRNTLQLNGGNEAKTPIFSELGLLAGVAQTDWSWATLLADLDGDGHKDLFITNGYRKNVTDRDFISFNEDFGLFGTDQARAQRREQLLERVPEIKLRNYAFRNRLGNPARDSASGPAFEDVSEAWGLNELSYANGAAYADLDGDGDLDLAVNNIDQEASLFLNHSRERQQATYLTVSFAGPDQNRSGIGATVRVWVGGQPQVYEHYPVRGYLSSVQSGLRIGLGKATMADSVQVIWPGGHRETRYRVQASQPLVFRFTSAKAAPAVRAPSPGLLFTGGSVIPDYQHQEADFVDFKTTPALHKMLSRSGGAVAAGDLNGDAYDDLAVGPSYRGSPGVLLFGGPDGRFTRKDWMPGTAMEAGDVLLFDADNDRDNDLLVVGGGNERPLHVREAFEPVLYRNDGRGKFTPSPLLAGLVVSSQTVRALDYDGDGDSDVLIAGRQVPGQYPSAPRSYLLRNDAGRFTDVTAQIAPDLASLGLVCDALALDLNNDRRPDLALVGEWMPPTILHNQNGRFTPASVPAFAQAAGWWNTLAAGDFDRDGDTDLLLGNEGLNTLYRASLEEPMLIYGKDFNEDGQFDPIMGYFINGTRYPAVPRETLNQQLIQFRRKYRYYAEYAKARFDELFTDQERKNLLEKQVTELRSCYAENRGDGTFTLRPLPTLAQQAPVFGFVVEDFDRDGHLDALATGNFYGNEANMGRQDASRGFLLRGNGRGGFTVLGPEQTGFRVAGDMRRSCRLRNPDRVVTAVNNGGLWVHGWR